VPESIGTTVRALRPSAVITLLQEDAEIERTVCVVTLRGASVRRLGARDISPGFQQDPQVARRRGMAAHVGPRIRGFGLGQSIPAL
jgi:hypothetical protein